MEHITKLMITPGRGRADEKIYGQFIEHLGSCINGGVYDPKSRFADENGIRYDRVIATRGNDYLLVYNYTNRPMKLDLSKISGAKKNVWWYSVTDGTLEYAGEFDSKVQPFHYDGAYGAGNDRVLIAVDATKDYITKEQKNIPTKY